MDEKNSKKKSKKPWECKEGCKVTATPCKHLEKLLPSASAGRGTDGAALIYKANIDEMNSLAYDYASSYSPERIKSFIKKLESIGLQEYEITILVDRFCHNRTLAQITEDRGFTSVGVTYYLFKGATNKIKRMGAGVFRKGK